MNKQIKWGIFLQYAQMALSIIIHLIYTPLMIKMLGNSEYGLYNLASSIISYLSLLSLGFGSSYIRYYSRYKSEGAEEEIKKLNGLYLTVFFIIGIIAAICGTILTLNVSIFFNSTYTAEEIRIAKILMAFLTVNLAVSFPFSIFTSYITSQEKFIFQKLLNVISTVFSPILSIIALYYGYGSIGMVIVSTIITFVVNAINIIYCFAKLKMRFSFRNLKFSLFKEIAVFSIFIAINQVIDQINWQTDKIILGKMINGTAVAIYAVASTINTMYINFSTAISSVFAPRVNMIVSKNEPDVNEQLTNLLIKVGRLQFFVIMLVLTGFILFGKYFVIKWAGADYEQSYVIALLLIVPVTFSLIQNVGIEIRRAKNKHQVVAIFMLIMAILNVGISILLVKFYGLVGVAIGTTISFVVNIIVTDIYYQKVLKINILKFIGSILTIIPSMIIPIAVGVVINLFWKIPNIYIFIVQILIYTIVYCIFVVIFGLNNEEKDSIFKFLRRKKNEENKDMQAENNIGE